MTDLFSDHSQLQVTLWPSSHLQPWQACRTKESWSKIISTIIVSFSDHFTYWQILAPMVVTKQVLPKQVPILHICHNIISMYIRVELASPCFSTDFIILVKLMDSVDISAGLWTDAKECYEACIILEAQYRLTMLNEDWKLKPVWDWPAKYRMDELWFGTNTWNITLSLGAYTILLNHRSHILR